MNPDWPRWIFTSTAQHFDTNKGTLDLVIEGQHIDTRNKKDYVELRIDGPSILEVSKNYFKLETNVNVLVQSVKDDVDWQRIHRNVGLVTAIFTDFIIYKYGSGVNDDGTQLECMKLKQGSINITHYGERSGVLQSTVEGNYLMFLEV